MTARRLLATDLDGTFIGDETAMLRLWRDLEGAGILVAFSTGRHLASVERFQANSGTSRRASACICMVGTEVWLREGDRYRADDRWSELIAGGWDREAVDDVVLRVARATRQPDEWQSPLKASYFLDGPADRPLRSIRRELDRLGIRAKVVYSKGRYLDVLPGGSGKGAAVAYVAERLGVPPDQVVTAGDSGNDLDMMRPELGFRSVAVGNASAELAGHEAARLYHAALPYAAGIREGLVEIGWLAV